MILSTVFENIKTQLFKKEKPGFYIAEFKDFNSFQFRISRAICVSVRPGFRSVSGQ
jgi:hypothetical protein